MPKRICITGGLGFIGHHLVQHVYKNTDWSIVIIDKLSYSSNGLQRLRDLSLDQDPRISVFTSDLSIIIPEGLRKELGLLDYIVHLAAETHVDNSIKDPVDVIRNNVMSTVHLLEYARSLKSLEKFLYFSTDEVFGPAPGDTMYREWDRHKPTNPYSASKAAAEDICLSYENTYKIPVIIINSMNVFGERQHVEKFIPKVIKNILTGKVTEIHSDKTCQNPGTRFYIHARNVSDAILFVLDKGLIGDKYNICGEREVSNLEMAQMIAKFMDKKLEYRLINFHEDRPGHDLRYGLDGSHLTELGWSIPVGFEDSLKKSILWTLNHLSWLES